MGKLFYIQVGNNATVLDLKKKIGAQEKLPVDRLILLMYEKLMNENESSLVDYGVEDGSHLYLFFDTLKDGLTHQSPLTTSESVNQLLTQQFSFSLLFCIFDLDNSINLKVTCVYKYANVVNLYTQAISIGNSGL